jgi:hypothetical protein
MLLDGEVAALISDWTSLYAFFDFMLLLGQVEWTDNQASFDALVPPPAGSGGASAAGYGSVSERRMPSVGVRIMWTAKSQHLR